MALGKKAAKIAGKKGLKAGRKILAKVIGLIGIPILIGGLCLVVIIGGISSQVQKQVSALQLQARKVFRKLTSEKVKLLM